MGPLAQVGLALATAAGAWLNLALLIWFARRRSFPRPGENTSGNSLRLIAAGIAMAIVLFFAMRYLAPHFAKMTTLRDEALLLALLAIGGAVYLAAIWALLGRPWVRGLVRGSERPSKP